MNIINLLVLLFTLHTGVKVKCDEAEDFGDYPLSVEDLVASLTVNNTVDNDDLLEHEADIDVSEQRTRNAISSHKVWRQCRVPYTIDRSKCLSKCRAVVAAAMSEIHAASGVRFVPPPGNNSYHVRITDEGRGCFWRVGETDSNQQTISLAQNGCIVKGIVIHELMHSLGFFHEQTRMDRDRYITVNEENVREKFQPQFNKINGVTYGLPYDYGSLMHYGPYAFSKNTEQLKTIETPYRAPRIGQRAELSELDKKRINKAYTGCRIINGGGSTSNAECKNLRNCIKQGSCKEKRHKSFLRKHCNKSRKKFTNNNCIDLQATSECKKFAKKGLCQQPRYRQALKKYCKNTCGFCKK